MSITKPKALRIAYLNSFCNIFFLNAPLLYLEQNSLLFLQYYHACEVEPPLTKIMLIQIVTGSFKLCQLDSENFCNQ